MEIWVLIGLSSRVQIAIYQRVNHTLGHITDYLLVHASKSLRVLFSVYCNNKMVENFAQQVLGAKGGSQYMLGTWEFNP